jgi:hypothetical protein
MRSRQRSFLLAAVFAVGALSASAAYGAVETKAGEWYTGATATGVTTLTGSQEITTEIAEHPGIGMKVEKKVVIAGVPIRVLATGFSCVECKVENKEVTSKAGKVAYGTGRLLLTGATVVEPSNCTISSETGVQGQVLTKPMLMHGDWKDTTVSNEKAFLQFIPAAGASAAFWQIKIGGAGCGAIEGTYNTSGSLFGELKSNRGEMKTVQELVVSPTVQATTGAALKLGSSTITLTGTAKISAGKNFFGIK